MCDAGTSQLTAVLWTVVLTFLADAEKARVWIREAANIVTVVDVR